MSLGQIALAGYGVLAGAAWVVSVIWRARDKREGRG